MLKHSLKSFTLASLFGLAACGGNDNKVSSNDAPINQTRAIFSPATGQVPVPGDLQFAAETARDGTMFVQVDPSNPVITGIDFLDGNSVLAPIDIVFDGSLDDTQNLSAANFVPVGSNVVPNPNQNIFLLPLTYPSGDALVSASISGVSVEFPTFVEALTYQSAAATAANTEAAPEARQAAIATLSALAIPAVRAEILSLDGGTNNVLRINPLRPLMPKTKYLVVVTQLNDRFGNAVLADESYQFLKNPETDLAQFGSARAAGLTPLRTAIQGWERLATGYFGFQQAVFSAAQIPATAPIAEDIIFSMTFTTGATTDVLTSMAAPESFFEESLASAAKKDAIVKVVSGQYLLDGTTNMSSATANDIAIADMLNDTLINNPSIPTSIRNAVSAGATWETLSTDPSAAYIIQSTVASVAVAVNNGDGLTLAQEAAGTVQAIAAGANSTVADLFPVPAERSTLFFRHDALSAINPTLGSPANVFQGQIELPYYLGRPNGSDASPVTTSSWVANALIGAVIDASRGNPPGTTPPSTKVTHRYPFPTRQGELTTVPILVTTPDSEAISDFVSKPDAGWPVIIFQHGITVERSTSLVMANALASACVTLDQTGTPTAAVPGTRCFATVAIDQPLHGIVPAGSVVPGISSSVSPNISTNTPSSALTERHFNLTADASANPTAMDETGSSGSLFLNLTSFATARDNLRQMSLDLLNVLASIDSMDLDGDGVADELDPDNVYFIGHSLGAINGLPFVAINNSAAVQNSPFSAQPRVKAAAGLMTGGGVIRLLTNSPTYAPRILAGLQAASEGALAQGKSGLETYFNVFQGVVDSADITNFADSLAGTGIYMAEVIGDLSIPNAADDGLWETPPLSLTLDTGFVIDQFPAPLVGTEPLLAALGATATAEAADPDNTQPQAVVTRFTEGSHTTPVSADNSAVFGELVDQILRFFATDGVITESIIGNPDIIEE